MADKADAAPVVTRLSCRTERVSSVESARGSPGFDLRQSDLALCSVNSNDGDMSIRSAVDNISPSQGISYVKVYFDLEKPYAGSFFETLEMEKSPENVYTASDFYALMCLEVDVPIGAGLSILGEKAEEISELLSQIPNVSLRSLSKEEFERYLGQDSPAMELWRILKSYRNVGSTRASKLMARKRPHLIPIQDSVIRRVAEFPRKANDWLLWWEALTKDDELECRADQLREAVDRPDLSTLRALDVMLWMSGSQKTNGLQDEGSDDE